MKDPSSELMKFRIAFEEYNFEMEYVSGSNNAATDALSWILRRLAVKDFSIDMTPTGLGPDQPRLVSTHIKPTEFVKFRFIDFNNLEKMRKEQIISSDNKILSYARNKTVIYVKYSNFVSQISRCEFVKEIDLLCVEKNIIEVSIIRSRDNDIFINKKLVE